MFQIGVSSVNSFTKGYKASLRFIYDILIIIIRRENKNTGIRKIVPAIFQVLRKRICANR